MKYCFCVVLSLLLQPVISQVPGLLSVTPLSGPVGTSVTISGNNFSTVPSNNIVYFGGSAATVTAASNTSLTVLVPKGATYKPISVTVNELTGYYYHPFIVTFPGGETAFTQNSFRYNYSGVSSSGYAQSIITSDLNNDGKPEVISAGNYLTSVYTNQSGNGQTLFSAAKILTNMYLQLFGITTGDINGDGLPDVISTGTSITSKNIVSIYINTTTNGSISFAPKIDIIDAGGESPYAVEVNDLNNDGKPDIILSNDQYRRITILQNTTVNGNVSFTSMTDLLTTGKTPFSLVCSDLDGDSRPDIAAANINDGTISVFQNTSTNGNITFGAAQTFTTSNSPRKIAAADIDGDGKPDLLTVNLRSDNISVLRNSSSAGTISFAPMLNFGVGSNPSDISVADFNGDGKADVAVSNLDTLGNTKNTVCILRNNSSNNTVSFLPAVFYTATNHNHPGAITAGDLNGDGQCDIAVCMAGNISILQNQIGYPVEKEICSGASTSFSCNSASVNYQWKVNTGNGFVDISDGAYYTGTNTNNLALSGIPSSFYGYQYECITDTDTSDVYKLVFSNVWTGAVNSTWENVANWSCGNLPDANTNVIVNSGSLVLNSNVNVRSLYLADGVTFTVNPGYTLTINH